MSYIAENPWPLVILLSAIAIAAFASGASQGKNIAAVTILLAIGVFFLEQSLVSPAEELEIEAQVMLDNFKANNLDAVSAQICNDKPELTQLAKRGLNMFELGSSFAIKGVQVTMDSESSATAMVRANGPVTILSNGGSRRVSTFWRTTWRLEGETWKLNGATQLNPVNGKEMSPFTAQ